MARPAAMSPDRRSEVAVLVASQMAYCVLGMVANNIVFVTLKDRPGIKASLMNVILCHLCFVNLMICTFIKPIASVYVAYAHAIVSLEIFGPTEGVLLDWIWQSLVSF